MFLQNSGRVTAIGWNTMWYCMATWCMTVLDIHNHPMASLGALGMKSSIMPETTARATSQKMTLQNPFFHPGTCLTLACSSSTSKLAWSHEFVAPFWHPHVLKARKQRLDGRKTKQSCRVCRCFFCHCCFCGYLSWRLGNGSAKAAYWNFC